jgi:hypothetical protein
MKKPVVFQYGDWFLLSITWLGIYIVPLGLATGWAIKNATACRGVVWV